jgi:uncharacterized protein DUF5994
MLTTIRRTAVVPMMQPSTPRLVLTTARVGRSVLDGGWWPRSWDPVKELPGLILALTDRYGPIGNVMLNRGVWDGHMRRLAVGTGVVRLGWFATLDAALLVAATLDGDQIELLVVPPTASAETAKKAMTAAADQGNIRRAPDILASCLQPAQPGGAVDGASAGTGPGPRHPS